MTRLIVHYTDSSGADFGGAELALLRVARGLTSPDWRCLLLHHVPRGSRLLAEAGKFGVPTLHVPRITGMWDLKGIARFISALRVNECVVFHAHQTWTLSCKHAVVAARLAGVPGVVATAQLFTELADGGFIRLHYKVMSAAIELQIAVSEHVARSLRQRFGVSSGKLVVLHNAIDVDSVVVGNPARFQVEIGAGDRPIVLAPARLDTQKGLTYLLQAAETLPDALIIVAGDGPLRNELEADVATRGLVGRVRFLGWRDDMPDLMAASSIVVLPSLNEGLPLVALEAMAAGVPVVATAIGGTDEAIVPGITGILVQPRDAAALGVALRTLLDDKELAQRMGAAGRVHVRAHFALPAMLAGLKSQYRRILENRGRWRESI